MFRVFDIKFGLFYTHLLISVELSSMKEIIQEKRQLEADMKKVIVEVRNEIGNILNIETAFYKRVHKSFTIEDMRNPPQQPSCV